MVEQRRKRENNRSSENQQINKIGAKKYRFRTADKLDE